MQQGYIWLMQVEYHQMSSSYQFLWYLLHVCHSHNSENSVGGLDGVV